MSEPTPPINPPSVLLRVLVLAGVALAGTLLGAVLVFRYPPLPGGDFCGNTRLTYQLEEHEDSQAAAERVGSILFAGSSQLTETRALDDSKLEVVVAHDLQTGEVDLDKVRRLIENQMSLDFRILATRNTDQFLIRMADKSFPKPATTAEGTVLARWLPVMPGYELGDFGDIVVEEQGDERWVLVVQDQYNVTGEALDRAYAVQDPETGQLAVSFRLTPEGGQRMEQLTFRYRPVDGIDRRLAICLDGQVFSAPVLRAVIGSTGLITADFTQEELDKTVHGLNAGTLPEMQLIDTSTFPPRYSRFLLPGILAAALLGGVLCAAYLLFRCRQPGVAAALASGLTVLALLALLELLWAVYTLVVLLSTLLTLTVWIGLNLRCGNLCCRNLQAGQDYSEATANGLRRTLIPGLILLVVSLLAGAGFYYLGYTQTGTLRLSFSNGDSQPIGAVLAGSGIIGAISSLIVQPLLLRALQPIPETAADLEDDLLEA